jgi:hypothetical protein
VCDAVGVLTEVLGFQLVLVGDVACSSGGDLVRLGPIGASGREDGEGVHGVGRAS